MKFGERLKKGRLSDYEDFYMDYDYLKQLINDNDVSYYHFLEMITIEYKKLNRFVKTVRDFNKTKEVDIMKFILLNYIGFYKIFKKFDKKRCENRKFDFYKTIQQQEFFNFYKKRTQCNEIKLVIFDKDGTIIDNTLMFGRWTKELVAKMNNIFPGLLDFKGDKPSLWKHLGYDYIKNKFDAASIVAKGTNDDIRNSLCDYIVNIRKLVICNTNEERIEVVDKIRAAWFDITVKKENIKLCGNFNAVLDFLRMHNIKVAICTSDDRKPTEETLTLLDINTRRGRSIDYLVCGNDMIESKPSPVPLLTICKKLNIEPKNAMMVGDTIADVHSGINAKFGKIVAVLSGGYNNTNLNEADIIIQNIDSLVKIFLDFGYNVKTGRR